MIKKKTQGQSFLESPPPIIEREDAVAAADKIILMEFE